MPTKDLLDIAFKLVGFINGFWAAYATVAVALLGWLFSSKRPWPWQQKLVISVAFGLIAAINCAAHYRFNIMISAVLDELSTRSDIQGLQPVVAGAKSSWSPSVLAWFHLAIDAGVVSVIWLHERFQRADPGPRPE